MSRIETELRGKRPRFFPAEGSDELVSMLLELTAELWAVKERLYALEKVAAEKGLDLTGGIEAWRPSSEDANELDGRRRQMIAGILRSVEAHHAPSHHLRREHDVAAKHRVENRADAATAETRAA